MEPQVQLATACDGSNSKVIYKLPISINSKWVDKSTQSASVVPCEPLRNDNDDEL